MSDKTISVSVEFLADPEIKEIFSSHIGRQLYLHIGTTHLRSQHFNGAILDVTNHLLSLEMLPTTENEMRKILYTYGYKDPSASRPFGRSIEPMFHKKIAEGEAANWREWNARIDAEKEKYQASVDEVDKSIMSIVNAINGVGAWGYEVMK